MEGNELCTCMRNEKGGDHDMAVEQKPVMVKIPLELYDRLRDDSLLLQKIITYQKSEEYSDRTINAILGIVKKDEEEA